MTFGQVVKYSGSYAYMVVGIRSDAETVVTLILLDTRGGTGDWIGTAGTVGITAIWDDDLQEWRTMP